MQLKRERERQRRRKEIERKEKQLPLSSVWVMAGRIHPSRLAISRTSGCTGSSANSLHPEKSIVRLCIPSACSTSPASRLALVSRRKGEDGKALGKTAFLRHPGRRARTPVFPLPHFPLLRFRHLVDAATRFPRETRCGSALLAGQGLQQAVGMHPPPFLPPPSLSISISISLSAEMCAEAKLRTKLRGSENISSFQHRALICREKNPNFRTIYLYDRKHSRELRRNFRTSRVRAHFSDKRRRGTLGAARERVDVTFSPPISRRTASAFIRRTNASAVG